MEERLCFILERYSLTTIPGVRKGRSSRQERMQRLWRSVAAGSPSLLSSSTGHQVPRGGITHGGILSCTHAKKTVNSLVLGNLRRTFKVEYNLQQAQRRRKQELSKLYMTYSERRGGELSVETVEQSDADPAAASL